jgi:hypothetical protein
MIGEGLARLVTASGSGAGASERLTGNAKAESFTTTIPPCRANGHRPSPSLPDQPERDLGRQRKVVNLPLCLQHFPGTIRDFGARPMEPHRVVPARHDRQTVRDGRLGSACSRSLTPKFPLICRAGDNLRNFVSCFAIDQIDRYFPRIFVNSALKLGPVFTQAQA